MTTPTHFSTTPHPPQTGGNMKSRKFTSPGAERDDELRRTVISSIMQELQHMDMDGLRNVLIIAEKQIEAQKKAR